MNIFKDFEKEISEIVIIHNFTKHYILLGEEIADDFKTYLQPVKEFRDAYEHIVRIFTKCVGIEDVSESSKEDYIRSNLSKALGHEYRAFFDVADWFSIICRKNIHELVKDHSYEEIILKCPEYPRIKERIFEIAQEITNIRERKDISYNIFEEVNRYQRVLVELLDYHRKLILCNL